MNKKQLIIAWITGLLVSFICLNSVRYNSYRIDAGETILCIIPILIVGILLILTLRDNDSLKWVKNCFVKIKESFSLKMHLIYNIVNNWVVRDKLLILSCLIIFVITTILLQLNKPHYGFDLVTAIPITEDGNPDIKLMSKEEVDKFLQKDTTGMSDQQIILEVNRIINSNVRKEKIIRMRYKILSILWIIVFIFYPGYLFVRFIRRKLK